MTLTSRVCCLRFLFVYKLYLQMNSRSPCGPILDDGTILAYILQALLPQCSPYMLP